jgi:hypothetical protein
MPAAQHHPLLAAHSEFVNRILAKPARIPLSGADEADVIERDCYIRHITSAYLKFMESLVDDLNENAASGEPVDFRDFLRSFTDLMSDRIYGPVIDIQRAVASAWDDDGLSDQEQHSTLHRAAQGV